MRELGIYFTLAQVGVEMVVPLLVGLVIDHYAAWGPWATVGGMIVGFVGGISHIVLLSNRQNSLQNKKKPPGESPP